MTDSTQRGAPARRPPAALMAVAVLLATALTAALLAGGTVTATQARAAVPLTVRITNSTAIPDDRVFVTIDPGGSGPVTVSGGGGLDVGFGNGTRLSSMTGSGTDAASHTYAFSLTGAVSSMRIYYSFGRDLDSAPSAERESVRYDYAELTTDGNGRFDGDLTAIDQVGIPARLQLLDGAGAVMTSGGAPADRHISCVQDVHDALRSAAPAGWDVESVVKRDAAGAFLRIIGPNAGPEASALYPSMRAYTQSLEGQTLTIKGNYAGNGSTNATAYDYSGVVDGDGNIRLAGSMTGGGYTPKTMFVSGGDLFDATTAGHSGYGIYLQNGPYTLDGAVTWDAGTSRWVYSGGGATQSVQNDVYGWIYGDLVTAFAYGYWGGKYGNDSSAFHSQPAFSSARTTASPFAAWSLYEQAIWQTSDSYGMSLGERFGSAGKASPLISTGPNPPVDTMALTLLANDGCSPLPDPDPSPNPNPGAKAKQVPKGKLHLPRKVKSKGKTVLMRRAATTNAGQRIAASISCTSTKGKKKLPCHVSKTRSGRVSIRLDGNRPTTVRLRLTAPQTSSYRAFAKVKVYRTKRVR